MTASEWRRDRPVGNARELEGGQLPRCRRRQPRRRLFSAVREFLGEPFIFVEPLDAEQADVAGDAYQRYGKGHHPAGLNLGDVFADAVARRKNLPLPFKGGDFARTGIEAA